MDDSDIVELFFDRSEQAISETGKKYGRYCYSIAYNILHNREDAEECVNDT
ncbi:MAG TPA: RNA polymerase subunit sigma-70, partial [Bacillota bacterium]|nr:RNA polymerase subunit sigma-70 [Bacillota bacterium]